MKEKEKLIFFAEENNLKKLMKEIERSRKKIKWNMKKKMEDLNIKRDDM